MSDVRAPAILARLALSAGLGAAVLAHAGTFTVTNTNDAGTGSLREAITLVNANCGTGPHTIAFGIAGAGPHVIQPFSELPTINCASTIVDGFSQPGSSPNTLPLGANDAVIKIELDGTNAGPGANGLVNGGFGDGSVVQGLSITRFDGAGFIFYGYFANGTNGALRGCYIGLSPDGSLNPNNGNTAGVAAGNAASQAVVLLFGAFGTVLGGPSAADANIIISGPISPAIVLAGSQGTQIFNTMIGVDRSGNPVAAAFRSATGIQGRFNFNYNYSSTGTVVGDAANGANVVVANTIGVDFDQPSIASSISRTRIFGMSGPPITSVPLVSLLGPPNVTRVTHSPSAIRFEGTIWTPNSVNHRVELFENLPPASPGQLGSFVADQVVAMTAGGPAPFDVTFSYPGVQNPAFTFTDLSTGQTSAVSTAYSPAISVSAPPGPYSVTAGGPAQFQTVTVTNISGAGILFGSPTGVVSGAGFTVGTDTCSGQTIPNNGTCTVDFGFSSASPGPFTGAGAIKLTAGGLETVQQFTLSATAAASLTVTNTNTSGAGSFVNAVATANSTCASGPYTIDFNIPGAGPHLIPAATALHANVTCAGTTIDGYSQPGASVNTKTDGTNDAVIKIVLDGLNTYNNSIFVGASNVTIRGLAFMRYNGDVIQVGNGRANTTIQGNYFGTDAGGMTPFPNGNVAIAFGSGTSGNVIGGATSCTPADTNLFVAGGGDIIRFGFNPNNGATIRCNVLGSDRAGGLTALTTGSAIYNAWAGTIDRNYIRGAANGGISFAGGNGTSGVTVSNNVISNNGSSGGGSGILASLNGGSGNHQILDNQVFLNGGAGIALNTVAGNLLSGNVVHSNGVVSAGAPGIDVGTGNQISGGSIYNNGGSTPGSGIRVSGTGNSISGVSIHQSGGRGIDISAATNDEAAPPYDTDTGPNNRQNFPNVLSVTQSAGNTTISGNLKTDGTSQNYKVELFANPGALREGFEFLGSLTVTTDGTGLATFSTTVTGVKDNITATATRMVAPFDTSEFSPSVAASVSGPAITFDPTSIVFANQAVGTTGAPRPVNLTNSGSATLNFTSIATTGDFSYVNVNCGATLAPATACTVDVSFTPAAAGTRTGTLVVTSDTGTSPDSIPLSGLGITQPAATKSFFPSTISPGAPSTLTITVANFNATTIDSLQVLDVYPAGVVNLATPGQATTCAAGSASATGGGNQVSFASTGPSIAANGSCDITVSVTSATPGGYTNTIPAGGVGPSGGVSSNQGASTTPASAVLTVSTTPTPVFLASPTAIAFGPVTVGSTSAPVSVRVSNDGNATLTISSLALPPQVALQGPCVPPFNLAPAASCTFDFAFTPTAPGPFAANVDFTTNASASPHRIPATGSGVAASAPVVSLFPRTLTFNPQSVGTTSAAQVVTLTNVGNATLNIASIVTSGDFGQATTCGPTLAATVSCTFNVTFSPIATGGRVGQVVITDDASGSPHVVSLSGTGLVAAAPTLALSDRILAFPDTTLGSRSAALAVTLANTGTVPLTISSITPSLEFPATTTCPSSLSPGGECTAYFAFEPQGMGTRTGTLSIVSNAISSPDSVALTGTGLSSRTGVLESRPASLAFSPVPVGSQGSYRPLVIANVGSGPAIVSSVSVEGDFVLAGGCAAIAPGGSCTLAVASAPVVPGVRRGMVIVRSDASSAVLAVDLEGRGAPLGPEATLGATRLDFGNQLLFVASVPLSTSLTNTGLSDLLIGQIAVTGSFLQANSCPAVLPPGASCQLGVRMFGTALGPAAGTLRIESNAEPASLALGGTTCRIYSTLRAQRGLLTCAR